MKDKSTITEYDTFHPPPPLLWTEVLCILNKPPYVYCEFR